MKKIILFLSLVIFSGIAFPVLASCDDPTGTIGVSKTEVQANDYFTITVTGYDDNDIYDLSVCYYASGVWTCDAKRCLFSQKECTRTWSFSFSAPGDYTFWGALKDSDATHGCLEDHVVTLPSPVTVTVKSVTNACQYSECNGLNMDPSCLCGRTPISSGKYCCSAYNDGEGKAFDNSTACLTQCPGALIDACSPNCESAPTGTCLCGDKVINKQYCCKALETGYSQQETCQAYCQAVLPSCDNFSCQSAEAEDCLCGTASIEAGQYCCAASDRGYDSKTSCQNDIQCRTSSTCNQLYGVWCPENNSCEGTDLTPQASDSPSYPDRVCCIGTCKAGTEPPVDDTPPTEPPDDDTPPGPSAPPPNVPTPGGETGGIDNPLKWKNFGELASAINNFIFTIAIVLAPIFFAIAGIMIVTAGGNPLTVQKAQKIMLYTAIGLAVILLAQAFVAVLKNVMGVNESTSYLPLIFSSLGLELKKMKGRIDFLN